MNMVPSWLLQELTSCAQAVSVPPAEVEIRVDQVENIVTEIVAYLQAQKVEITDHDVKTIKDVTNWQVYAKVAHARRIGTFNANSSEDSLIQTIGRHFGEVLIPMALLVDQIGYFEYQGKAFYPKVARPDIPANVPAGYVATPVTIGARGLYIQPIKGQPLENFAANPELLAGIPVERLHWSEDSISFTHMIQNYEGFLHRVRRKMPHLLTNVDLASGKGTAAQLVGTRPDPLNCRRHLAWSKLKLSFLELCLGAGFGFGLGSNDYWHRYDMLILSQTTLYLTAFVTKLMRVRVRVNSKTVPSNGYESVKKESDEDKEV